MANRRMFSKSITRSSRFLRMPATSRLLYYDLGMEADDDGYCEWFPVLQTNNGTTQDLEVLQANKFIKIFDDNVLIINDWKENNYLRPDRYIASKYSKVYHIEDSGIPTVNHLVDKVATQDRIGKVRVGKDRSLNTLEPQSDSTVGQDVWIQHVGTQLRSKLQENERAYERLTLLLGDRLPDLLKVMRYARADRYAGKDMHVIGNYIQLEKNLEKVEAYAQGKQDSKFVEKKKVGKYDPNFVG